MPPEEVIQEGEQNTPAPTDDVKNLKAEFNRKLDNVSELIKSLNDQVQAAVKTQVSNAPAPANDKDLSDRLYEEPDAVFNEFGQRIVQQVTEKFTSHRQREQELGRLFQDYPELASDGELTQAVNAMLPQGKKLDEIPIEHIKSAVYQAAAYQGLKPKGKRTVQTPDDVDLGGKGGSSLNTKKDKTELSEAQMAWLELTGGASKERVERVKEIAKRRRFGRYESIELPKKGGK